MTHGLALATLMLASGTVPASSETQSPWPSPLGSGLLTLQDTATLPKGRFTVAFTVDNRDRDPLGLDIFDGALAWNVGLGRAEFYGNYIFSRGVAVPDTPVLPPPPLDLILLPGAPLPQRPYYSLYSPLPFVDDSGPIRFGSDIQGDAVLGGKVRALAPKGWRPGLAGSFEVKIPVTKELRYLQAGSGTGGVDLAFRVVGESRPGPRWSLVASATFNRVGRPAFQDQRIESQAGKPTAIEEPVVLPNRVDLGVGARFALKRYLALVGEIVTVIEQGSYTRRLDPARPVDFIGGVQTRWKALRVTGSLRYHGNDLPSMQNRPAPLAGLIDVTRVSDANLAAYLRAAGLPGAESLLRAGAHRMVVPVPGAPALPLGARVIPPTYRIRSEHQIGFVLLAGLSF